MTQEYGYAFALAVFRCVLPCSDGAVVEPVLLAFRMAVMPASVQHISFGTYGWKSARPQLYRKRGYTVIYPVGEFVRASP